MQMDNNASTETGVRGHLRQWPRKLATKVADMAATVTKLARDDPRRVTHSLKVGLALTLVSITYYLQPVYDNFEETAIWTVMTVVVVFDFTVGGTLSRGLNRAAATLVAGALGLGVHHLASLAGRIPESVLLATFVFLLATASTFIRFAPKIKAKYDYGMLIFILTFCLISVSGFREEDVIKMAYNRLSTVFIGGALCFIVSIGICPVWAGENLHNHIALNIDKLANFLQGFGEEYFKTSVTGEDANGGRSLQGYKSILGSKSSEEVLANFAYWEPRHGKFWFRHPWQQYLKLGELIRQCAYRIDSLNAHLNTNTKAPVQIREQIEETFKSISSNTGKALKELSIAVKTMTRQQNPNLHLENSINAVKKLKASLKVCTWKDEDLLTVLPCVTVASLLIEVVECTEKVVEAVDELAKLAGFQTMATDAGAGATTPVPKRCLSARVQPERHDSFPHVVFTILDEPEHAQNTIPVTSPRSARYSVKTPRRVKSARLEKKPSVDRVEEEVFCQTLGE